jgi:hypothetical protein
VNHWKAVACAFALALSCQPATNAHAAKAKPQNTSQKQATNTRATNTQQAKAKATSDIRTLLPKRSRIVISVNQFQAIFQAFQTTPLYNLFMDAELVPLRRRITNSLFGKRRQYDRRKRKWVKGPSRWDMMQSFTRQLTGFTLTEAGSIFAGPHTFALVRVPRGSEPLDIAGALRVTDTKKAKAFVKGLLHRIPLRRSSQTYKGIRIASLHGLENALYYAWHGNHALFSSTARTIKQMIDNAKGGKQHLLQAKGYKHFLQQTGTTKGLSLYVATHQLLNDMALHVNNQRSFALRLLGLNTWKSLGLTMSIKDKRFLTAFHLAFKKGAAITGPSRLLAMKPADTKLLSTLPKRPVLATLTRIPWAKLWMDALQSLKQAQPRQYKRMTRTIGQIERGLLRTSIKQILQDFGEHTAFYVYPYQSGGLLPQMTMVSKLNKPKTIQKLLNTLLALGQVRTVKATYRGISYRMLHPGFRLYRVLYKLPRFLRGPASLFLSRGNSSCYAFVGDQMWLAFNSQTMRNFIDQVHANKHGKKSTPLPAPTVGGWLRFDPSMFVTQWYQTVMAAGPFLGRMMRRMPFVGGLPFREYPRAKVVQRYITPLTVTSTHTAPNTLMTARSGLGLEWMLLGGAIVSTGSRLMLQYRVDRYVSDTFDFLRLEKETKQREANGQYAAAAQAWKRLARHASLSAIRLTAQQHVKQLQTKYKAALQNVQAQLQQYNKRAKANIPRWQLQGDWHVLDGTLRTLSSRRLGNTLTIGSPDLKEYVLQFEVRNPTKGFSVNVHVQPKWLQQKHRRYTYNSYKLRRKIYFGSRRFQRNAWTPMKIKVKGKRISYWFGLKHRVLRAHPKSGLIQFQSPAGGHLELRRIRLALPTQKAKPKTQSKPLLHMSFTGTPSTAGKGEVASYRLVLRNTGKTMNGPIKLRIQLPKHTSLESVIVTPGRTHVLTTKGQDITFAPIDSLTTNTPLRITLKVKCKRAGIAVGKAFLQLPKGQSQIVLSGWIHISPN